MTYLYGHQSDDIKKLQEALGINADGGFGKDTLAAVIKYQTDNNLEPADGVVRQDMLDKLFPKPVKVNFLQFLPLIISLTEGKLNMNKDQVIALVTAVIQVVSGVAIAKGIGDQALWEAALAFVIAASTYGFAHWHNK